MRFTQQQVEQMVAELRAAEGVVIEARSMGVLGHDTEHGVVMLRFERQDADSVYVSVPMPMMAEAMYDILADALGPLLRGPQQVSDVLGRGLAGGARWPTNGA